MEDGKKLLNFVIKIIGWIVGLFSGWILLIVVFVGLIAATVFGGVSNSVVVTEADTDNYYIAIANVMEEYNIEQSFNANILKSACIISENTCNDVATAEKVLKDYFVKTIVKATKKTTKAQTTIATTVKPTTVKSTSSDFKDLPTTNNNDGLTGILVPDMNNDGIINMVDFLLYKQQQSLQQPTTSAPTTTVAPTTEPEKTYEFYSTSELKAILKKPPFNLNEKEIEQIIDFGELPEATKK